MKNGLKIIVLICFFGIATNAQEPTVRKQLATQPEISKIEALLNSQQFEFVANTMYPMGLQPKNLVGSGNSVTFSPELIISNLPFYGRSYTAITMGRDKGMRFKGAPENFVVKKTAKYYKVTTSVTGQRDTYSLSLSVSKSGYATLSITSKNRDIINYHGEIVAVKQ